jgi:hypothetical protein
MIIQPAISCKHTRSFIFSEFIAPEIDSCDAERLGMILRAVWPHFGVRISHRGDIYIEESLQSILESKSLTYLSQDLEFTMRNKDGSVEIIFSAPVHWENGEPITILTPQVSVTSKTQLRRRSSTSSSSCGEEETATYYESPYTVSSKPGWFGIVCPKCVDKCSIEFQLKILEHEDKRVKCPPESTSTHLPDITHFDDDVCCLHSEGIQSLDSLSGRSEVALRRASCPPIFESSVSHLVVTKQRLTVTSCDPVIHVSEATLPSQISRIEERKERIKQSLSRLSASIASSHEASFHEKSSKVEEEDLLSQVSSISHHFDEENVQPTNVSAASPVVTGTLRIQGKPPIAPPQPESGYISNLGTSSAVFTPTPLGRELMDIFSSSSPQETIWKTLIEKSKSPIEYADIARKMPSIVFCLRGIIRHGDGDFGSTRPEVIPLLFHVVSNRHPVCETSAGLEASECAATILSLLAVSPVSRHSNRPLDLQVRPRCEPFLVAQNGIIFQQVVVVLSQQIPKWTSKERDPILPVTNRAVNALLDIVIIYSNSEKLRLIWIRNAPPLFKHNLSILIASIPERLPLTLPKCLTVLDLLLEHLVIDRETSRRTAQLLHGAVHKVARQSPQLANDAMQLISKWSVQMMGPKKRSKSISNLFGLVKSKPTLSVKSTVFNEYQTISGGYINH